MSTREQDVSASAALDLESIRQRMDAVEEAGGLLDDTHELPRHEVYGLVCEDVPALIAEVERLRAALGAPQREWICPRCHLRDDAPGGTDVEF